MQSAAQLPGGYNVFFCDYFLMRRCRTNSPVASTMKVSNMPSISALCSICATQISLKNCLRAITSTKVQSTMTVAMAMRMLGPQARMCSNLLNMKHAPAKQPAARAKVRGCPSPRNTGGVAKNQDQIESPKHRVELHEGDDARVARHWFEHHCIASSRKHFLLHPVDGIAPRAETADIDERKHHENTMSP